MAVGKKFFISERIRWKKGPFGTKWNWSQWMDLLKREGALYLTPRCYIHPRWHFWVVRDDSGHLFLLPEKRDCVSVSQTQGLTELQCCQGRMKMSRRTSLPDCATVTTLPPYKSNGKPVEQVESKVKPQKVSKQYHVLDSCFLRWEDVNEKTSLNAAKFFTRPCRGVSINGTIIL